MPPDNPGVSDPDEVKRARAKYIATMRAIRRHQNRMADIDWEYDTLKPGLKQLEQTITVVGELPSFHIIEDEHDGQG